MTCGPLVVTVASNWSICAPNWLLIKPTPATTKPRMAAGPIAANAILATDVIPFAILAIADTPSPAAWRNPWAVAFPSSSSFSNPAEIVSKTLPIADPEV